ncbi:MAG: YnbE family lipoprotein [Kiloniellaceae bacterium]
MVSFGGRHAVLGAALLGTALAACTPTVQVAAPKEPITINLNVKLDAEVRVKIEEQAAKDIEANPDVF